MRHAVAAALAGLLAGTVLASACPANEIGFVEDYVLARDKDEAIKKLVPGTEEYFYYLCLRNQGVGKLDEVDAVLKRWLAHNKGRRTARIVEMEHRQALLRYRQDPAGTLKYLTDKLKLRFDHERQVAGKSALPTRLDEKLIRRETLIPKAFAASSRLDGFEPSALEWLIAMDMEPRRTRHLLQMLPRGDYDQLVSLIVADLKAKDSRGFGSLPIHNKLLRSQLDELLKRMPELLKASRFVHLYLTRLRPSDDVNRRENDAEQLAYLDRMWAFVKGLQPAFNSLKAHVLYHRLTFDRARGVYDKDLFLEYLKLPRRVPYVRAEFLQSAANRNWPASLSSNFQPQTLLPPIGTDEPLVRSYLAHFFVEEDSYDAYATYLKDSYLKAVFAETKILNGIGDPEKWARMLSAAAYKALTDRVDLDFAHTNSRFFAPDEKIKLDVYVKNVPKLIVKVYRVNALKYYQQKGQPVPIGLDLDGLVANEQKTHAYKDPPARRIRRRFEFPGLTGRGVYVIELIGSGKRSRVLVRKGRLDYVVRTTPAGHEFTVLDESGAKVPDAALWMAGHLYAADKDDGTITVPFTNSPKRQNIVLMHKGAASLAAFHHLSESYTLQCGFYVDREALLKRKQAKLIVRPQLRLGGAPVSLSLLKQVELTITSRDRDGISTARRVRDFKLFEDRESTHAFRVPDRLSRIAFSLTAKVRNLSKNREDALSASKTFRLNGIDATATVGDLHLLRADGKYILEMLGRNGEPLSERPVALRLKHRDFKRTVDVSLKTDARGRIWLGALKDIARISTSHGAKMEVPHTWVLADGRNNYPQTLHGTVGERLTLPAPAGADGALRRELSLLEYRGGAPVADWFKALRLRNGMVEVGPLPAGRYRLVLKRIGQEIGIRITGGKAVAGFQVSATAKLERRDAKVVQIRSVTADKNAVKIQLTGATKFTRVHVIAARYMPEYDLFASLHPFGWLAPMEGAVSRPQSLYVAGRRISDEYRYILDRRYAEKLPGNMLKRPSLILNPWSIRKTDTGRARGGEGEAVGGPREAPARPPSVRFAPARTVRPPSRNFANLDFLANGAVVLANLRPDKNGLVTIPRKDLLDKQHVRVLTADPENTAACELTLPEAKAALRDLRLDDAAALGPKKHYTQQKKITVAPKGKPFVLRDVTTTRFETFDSLAKVYRLYTTLSRNAHLREFAFVLQWPKLKGEEKRAKYSKYACHELHFFLYRKDPQFFRQVVLPYLKNKKDKTFLDHWLCGEDLGEYLKPWRHAQLNIVERILLAQRVAGERPHTARHVKDLHDLLPPDVDRFNRLFDTALGLSGLRPASGKLGERELGVDRDKGARLAGTELRDLAEKLTEEAAARTSLASLARRARPAAKPKAPPKATPTPAPPLLPPGAAKPYYDARKAGRARARQFYRKLGQVQEWVESNYYHLPIEQAKASLITVNAFWRDYAAFDGKGPFFSTNFAEASRSFPEMMLALAVLDLPFEAPKHKAAVKGGSMTITPAEAAVVFHEEINEARTVPKVMPILVSQNYYRLGSRYRHVDGEKLDNFVTDEFLLGEVYGCHVVVTNPTSSRRKLQVLTQVPRGAVPVSSGKYTRASYILLEPYRTQTFDSFFYFPAAGSFDHYPVHVARRGVLVAFARPTTLKVVEKLTKVDKTSWDFVSQNAGRDEVLAYLRDNNVNRLDLARIAWRARDKAFFQAVIELLTRRHVYDHTLWSYGIKHNVPAVIREYLQHRGPFVGQCGRALDSPLLRIDPVVRKTYQHIEYWPLVNARAHGFGARRKILVQRFHAQYHELMNILRYRNELSDEDLMAVTYYLLLQDRVEEAIGLFQRVEPANLPTRLQHDYFAAYLDFFNDKPDTARKIAAKYADYPVERWRNLFAAVLTQLDEIAGHAPKVLDKKDRDEVQTDLAASEETFEFTVEAKKITLNYQNLDAATVNYYLMDIELMFSRQPFVADRGGQFAYIQPNRTQQVKLPADKKTLTIDLPAELHNRNVMVEVVAGGKTRSAAYYSHSLVVQMMENYGQLRVTHEKTGRPLAKAYVKVYARMGGGQVEFYKDGYTDLRGRFDYTSLNTGQLGGVQKFAVLILSEEHGSTVREAKPPKR